jgi:hypothetical protein
MHDGGNPQFSLKFLLFWSLHSHRLESIFVAGLSLNERNLPDALATPTLLNPMFGSKKRIVGSGLMSKDSTSRRVRTSFVKFKTSSTKTIPSFALNYPTAAPAVMMMMMTSLCMIIQIMVRQRKNWRSLSALSGRSISQH